MTVAMTVMMTRRFVFWSAGSFVLSKVAVGTALLGLDFPTIQPAPRVLQRI